MRLDDDFFDSNMIYLSYDFEGVLFRWDRTRSLIFLKFIGEEERVTPIPSENRLFTDALRFGKKISKDEYEKGGCL